MRKQREQQRRKEEIFDVALNLFSSKGFNNVSMQEIADKSEFAVGTLYNFFDSKESLFKSLIDYYREKVFGEVSEILDGPGNESERLVAYIRNEPHIQEKYSKVIKVYASSTTQDQWKFKEALTLKIMHLLEKGIRKGFFRAVDPEMASKALISTLQSITFEIAGHFDKAKATETYKKVEQLFINDLLTPETPKND